jgi:hypothetical protein
MAGGVVQRLLGDGYCLAWLPYPLLYIPQAGTGSGTSRSPPV